MYMRRGWRAAASGLGSGCKGWVSLALQQQGLQPCKHTDMRPGHSPSTTSQAGLLVAQRLQAWTCQQLKAASSTRIELERQVCAVTRWPDRMPYDALCGAPIEGWPGSTSVRV